MKSTKVDEGERHGLEDYGRRFGRVAIDTFEKEENGLNSVIGGWAYHGMDSPTYDSLLEQDALIVKSLKYSSDREKILLWIGQLKQAATDLSKSSSQGITTMKDGTTVNFNLDLRVKENINTRESIIDGESGFNADEILRNQDSVFSIGRESCVSGDFSGSFER